MATAQNTLQIDREAVLLALRESDDGEASSSDLREVTGLSLARVNRALDLLRVEGYAVETVSVRDTRTGDVADVWEVATNRGWAKVWVYRPDWTRAVLPNGREPIPATARNVPRAFRAAWER